MALVHVKDRRTQALGSERAKSADAQHDLLPHARVNVASVKAK